MNCPICGGKTTVRGCKADCESIHRERKCLECNHIFYTEEYEVETSERYDELVLEYNRNRRKKTGE